MEAILYNRYRSLEEDAGSLKGPKNFIELLVFAFGIILGLILSFLIIFLILFFLTKL